MTLTVNIRGPVMPTGEFADAIRRALKEVVMKFKVLEDVSLSIGPGPEQTFKAGIHEAREKDREALEHLEQVGLAERVKSTKEDES